MALLSETNMECKVWSPALHNIHRKAKKVTRLFEGQLHSTNTVFPKKYADLDLVSTQLTLSMYLGISPAPLLGRSHSNFIFKEKKQNCGIEEESENSKPELLLYSHFTTMPLVENACPFWSSLPHL